MATPTTADRASVRPRSIRFVGVLLRLVAAYLLVTGLSSSIGAATRAPATVRVPVAVTAGTPDLASAGFAVTDRVERLDDLVVPGEGTWVTASGDASRFTLSSWNSTELEQFLSRGDRLVLGVAAAVLALLLRPVLMSLAGPRPFARRNARRLAGTALTVLVAAVLHPFPPRLAAEMVLERLGHPAGLTVPAVEWHVLPVLAVVGGLLLLAEAFRHAERLEHEVEGLV